MVLNNFDEAFLLLILFIGLKGLFNGAIRELSGLIGVIFGVWAGSRLAPSFGSWICSHLFCIHSPSAMTLIAFMLLLLFSWSLFIVSGIWFEKRFEIKIVAWIDRITGLLFASLKSFVIVAVIIYALSSVEFMEKNAKPYLKASLFYPLLIRTGRTLMRLPPPPVSSKIDQPKGQK